ncbi:AP-3 complex subunit mu-2 [Lobosporangium transversale]|uniref:AP-3 complex subunit MU-2 n=1 Tax=Lobosporangium transversale TaxID=64571 RepID=A0A1Y2GCV7_9FUNG|nr:AP-3 complex subunit MU-2 [Lobosporangium transversale]KAF9899288.1 AP-3 complex subunit mu-2 [Lobosporangium transversale]ORZ07274.1 AP-3 complex subunit MU-2 [Lobosporangium transversale]|eukprot:XP_021877937.1 AP-3 complex subunit MU-2 [Lobosporangium transversale]
MIESLFVLSSTGKVIIEKHWHELIPRPVVDYFNEQVSKAMAASEDISREDVLPIIPSPKYQLINVYRDGLTYLSPVTKEVDPMMVFEFLHRILDIMQEYFGTVSETTIKENFVTVYQLLEEMMDDGYPLTTEPNALKEIVPAPNILDKVISTMGAPTSVSTKKMPHGMSNLPWRKAGVKYATNEIYFDIIEEIDAIVDSTGKAVSCEAHGTIQANCRLSGMPDLTLSLVNPRLVDDCSFHPSVRFNKWESDKVLSFVPPDGHFQLMSYRVNLPSQQNLPVQVKPSINIGTNGAKFDITVCLRNTEGKSLEDVVLILPLHKSTTNLTAHCNVGQYMFDPVGKVLRWDIGKIVPRERAPVISGSFAFGSANSEAAANAGYNIGLEFMIKQHSLSGLMLEGMKLFNESKPFKLRRITKAGRYQIRA